MVERVRDIAHDGKRVEPSKKESEAIAVKQSEVTSLLIPTNTKPGVYTASVSVNYQGGIYAGTKTFEVLGNKKLNLSSIFLYVFVIIVFVLLFILYRKKISKKHKKSRKHKGRR